MRFEILGPLRVFDGGTALDVGGPRQQTVLALLLAAAPDPLSVDRLVDEVWGERPPETASHVIRTYVSGLRKLLGDRIISDGRHYRIDMAGDPFDAAEYCEALEQARSAFPSDPAKTSAILRDSAGLWRGRPFGDLADGAPLIEWRAAELEERRLQSLELLIAAELALGHHEERIAELQALSMAHPHRERLHQYLMLALYRAGRQAEAIRVGWNLRNRLIEEMGIEPSMETRKLEDRILVQDPGLDLSPPTNLPAFVSSFIGRDREIAEVSKLIDVQRLVTLIGVGGVGKTRLAHQVGSRVLDRFPDGVWWVDLASSAPDADVPAKVAEVLGLADQPGIETEALLGRYLARRAALLVIDNCEHMADRVAKLSMGLLETAPNLKVLATSRRALHAPGEVRCRVPPMSIALGGDLFGFSDAERLFAERSRHIDDDFAATDDTAADVAEICRTLEGLPLAIEMAAVRVAAMSPAQIAARLTDRLRFLVAGGQEDSRHRSLVAAIDWSYDLLTPGQRALFNRLSIFVGSFDLSAAEAIASVGANDTAGVVDDIAALVDASMLTCERPGDGTVRYRLLDTLREHGRAKLLEHGETDVLARLHSRHFLGLVERSADLRFTPDHPAAMVEIDAANDDLLAALDWSLDHDPRRITLMAAPGLAGYWFWRGDPLHAYRYGKRLLDGAGLRRGATLAAAHVCVGFGAQLVGDFAGAAEAMGTALEILEQDDDWKLLLWAYNGAGQGGVFGEDLDLTAVMGRRILELCEAHEAVLPRAYGLALLGEAGFFADQDFDMARRSVSEAAPLFRELGDEAALNMFSLGILASLAALQCDFGTAERAAVEASTLGGPGWSATALIILGGFVLHPRGETDRAEIILKRGVLRVHEHSMVIWARCGLMLLGRIAADRGRWEDAARLFGGCRPNLPTWAAHKRWWNYEPAVISALGEDIYRSIAAAAAEESLDDLVAWATGSEI